MRILVFSYFYPPAYEVGGKRFSNLTHNWVNSGWQVGVVSAELSAYRALDDSQAVPGTVFRSRVRPAPHSRNYSGPFRLLHKLWSSYLVHIDRQQGWIRSAVKCGIEASETVRPEAIVATGPPFSSFAAGSRTARLLDIPLILDYRDPWSSQVSSRFPPPLGPSPGRKLELQTLTQAEAVVSCTERLSEQVQRSFGFSSEKFYTVTNGFTRVHTGSRKLDGTDFTILHAGSFYGQRSLKPLIEGVLQLKARAVSVKVRVLGGPVTDGDKLEYEARGCADCLEPAGPLPYKKALEEMACADVLYLPSGRDVNYALPYKFFDYLSTGKPVLAACSEDSAVHDYVVSSGCGGSFRPEDSSGIAEYLVGIYSGNAPEMKNTDRFLWSNLARRYGEIILKHCSCLEGRSE